MLFTTHPSSFAFNPNYSRTKKEISHLQKRIHFLKNMMELFDIIANIWPRPKILQRISEMDAELKSLLGHQKILLNQFI